MTDPESRIEALQKAFCAEHAAEYIPARSELKSGLALSTRGLMPINGLRHPLEGIRLDGISGPVNIIPMPQTSLRLSIPATSTMITLN